jgi:hypothetical protein
MKKVLWLDWSVDPADMEKPESYPTPMSAKKGKTGNTIQEWGNNRFRREPFKNGTGPIPRVATGIKDRVNRLKALGNGQVPLCAAAAWHILTQNFFAPKRTPDAPKTGKVADRADEKSIA